MDEVHPEESTENNIKVEIKNTGITDHKVAPSTPNETPGIVVSPENGAGGKGSSLNKNIWRNPIALVFIAIFAIGGGYLLINSFASTVSLTKSWSTTADWNSGALNKVVVANNTVTLATATTTTTGGSTGSTGSTGGSTGSTGGSTGSTGSTGGSTGSTGGSTGSTGGSTGSTGSSGGSTGNTGGSTGSTGSTGGYTGSTGGSTGSTGESGSSNGSLNSKDLALHRPSRASSINRGNPHNTLLPAYAAFDGKANTRWGSRYSDPQWIYVDLGKTYNISEVKLTWEVAYGKAYQIQVSNNTKNWTTIYSTTTGTGGVNDLTGLKGSGRYVRMYGTARGTKWGYSLWSMNVYGSSATVAVSSASSTNTGVLGATTGPTYVPAGDITLSYDAGSTVNWTTIAWGTNTPTGTNITYDLRTSSDNSTWSTWISSTNIANLANSRYVQVRANLSTTDTTVTPSLTGLTLNYDATVATPTATLSGTPTTITAGQTSTISWSSVNATTCTASGSWTGAQATSGSITVTPTATSTYNLSCNGSGGTVTATPVTITVNPVVSTGGGGGSSSAHVMVIMMENQPYSSIIGNSSAPYMNSLAKSYQSATNSYGVGHYSLDNYLAMISGNFYTWSTGDCAPGSGCQTSATTLANQLDTAGVSWTGYFGGMTSNCSKSDQGGSSGYGVRHNPFVYFTNVVPADCAKVVPDTNMLTDLNSSSAPNFVWYSPVMCNNGGGDASCATIANGDTWLSKEIPAIQATSWYKNGGKIILTFDESSDSDTSGQNGDAGGHVYTVVISANASGKGSFTTYIDSYGILRSIQNSYGLSCLGSSCNATSGSIGL